MEEKKDKKFDLKEKAKDVKSKAKDIVKKVKIEDKDKEIKPLVTSRVLFISVLDKILLIILLLSLAISTFTVFVGNIASLNYNFFFRLFIYIWVLVYHVVMFFLYEWIYRCAAKTMLCLTENEVYLEQYILLKRTEKSIPLSKITKVTAIDFIWIFRVLIIHQYHQLPKVFWTWNNHEFKDKLNELITGDSGKIENKVKTKSILPKRWGLFLIILGSVVAGIVLLIGAGRFLAYVTHPAHNLNGTFVDGNGNSITLRKDGTCTFTDEVADFLDNESFVSCHWSYIDYAEKVKLEYEYEYISGYYNHTYEDTIYLNLVNSKTLVDSYDGTTYKK